MVPPQVDGRGRQNSIVRCFRPARCQSRAAQRLGDGVIAHQRRHALEVRGLPGQFSETSPQDVNGKPVSALPKAM